MLTPAGSSGCACAGCRRSPPPSRPEVEAVTGLAPWRRRGLLVLAGMMAAAALPPLHLVPLLWLALPVLLWLADADPRPSRAFAAGWWFGLGHFAAGLYWVSHALLIEPLRHGWLVPFALVGLGGGLGIFTGLAALATRLAPRGAARVLAFAAAWTGMEWLRGWMLTGFPWNLVATVWMPSDAMLQAVSSVGAYGLGLLTVAAAGMPALLGWAPPRRAVAWVAGGLAGLAAVWVGGAARLAGAEAGDVPGVVLRLVQPAIAQSSKWNPELRLRHLQEQVAMSRVAGFERVTHVVWAETAAPFFLDLDDNARAIAAQAAPPGGALITGAPRRTPPGEEFRIWNSLFGIDAAGRVVGLYDKVHLVPFGEYVPLRMIIPAGVEKLTVGSVDFTPGPRRMSVAVPGAPSFSPLICYEIVFPTEVLPDGARPRWIVNLTNDGWFGISAGPYQHYAAARLRAAEEGLPVVRVANTGISAVIDPFGRERVRLGLGEQGVIDAALPEALPPTPFARWGNLLPLALAAATFAISVLLRRAEGK